MKKIILPICLLLCLVCFCACSADPKEPDANQDQVLNQDYEKYGLSFSEEEIKEAIKAAELYYEKEAVSPVDSTKFNKDELLEIKQWKDLLAQGLDITYDAEKMHAAIESSSLKDEISQRGAGHVILLQVVVSSAPSDHPQKNRTIELYRESISSEWIVRTEGI